MAIKEKSIFRKHVLEYESPDSTKESPDVWDIVIVEHGDRKYIQYKKSADSEFITIDGAMLLDMADAYRKITMKTGFIQQSTTRGSFEPPSIVDHRAIEKRGSDIQQTVEETMRNQDSSVEPIQSFSPAPNTPSVVTNDYTEFRTGGVTTEMAAEEASETPSEWSVQKPSEDLKPWQKDAQARGKVRPPSKKAGGSGEGFKRVGARDII